MKSRILIQLLQQYFRKKPKTRERLLAWQNQQIEKHINQIINFSPFYATQLKKYKHWSKFPLLNKQLFMEHFDQINSKGIFKEDAMNIALAAEKSRDFSPMIGDITVGLSSGTSGNRGIFLVNPKERAQWVAYVLRHVLGIQFKNRKVAFFLRANSNLYSSVQSKLLSFQFFDLKTPLADNLSALKSSKNYFCC